MHPHFSKVFAVGLTAALGLASGCSGSQPITTAANAPAQAVVVNRPAESLNGFYLTKFTTTVGSSLPESTFCFHFKSSGFWSNTGSESFSGTYLTAGNQLFATALWLPSPAVYLSVQGFVGARRSTGHFIVSTGSGNISGGGSYTMKQSQTSDCT